MVSVSILVDPLFKLFRVTASTPQLVYYSVVGGRGPYKGCCLLINKKIAHDVAAANLLSCPSGPLPSV